MIRSWLYVPGDRPERFEKALAAADAAILDLEDAVAVSMKDEARANVAAFLQTEFQGSAWVRINSGPRMLEDASAVVAPALQGISVPKAESPADIHRLDEVLTKAEQATGLTPGAIQLTLLVESAKGILNAAALASCPRVRSLGMGEADLTAELGVSPSEDGREMWAYRSQVIVASAAAGLVSPTAPVSTDFRDLDALRASTTALKRAGFGARGAIHPAQVPVINEVFTPTPEELERAKQIIEAYESATTAGTGVIVGPDGRMVDEAVIRAARRTLGH